MHRSSRRSERSSSRHHRNREKDREARERREPRDRDARERRERERREHSADRAGASSRSARSQESRKHRKLSRTNSDWMDRLSVAHPGTHGDHPDYDMYSGHKPLEQTRSDTSSEMHYSPKPRIYKVKSLDLKPEGHYKKSGENSPDDMEVSAGRRPRHRPSVENPKQGNRSPEAHFVDPAEVIKRKAIELIEAELGKHSSLQAVAERLQMPSGDTAVPSETNHVQPEAAPSEKAKEVKSVMSVSSTDAVSQDTHKSSDDKIPAESDHLKVSADKMENSAQIELYKRTPSGHFHHISLDDDERASEPGFSHKQHRFLSREASSEGASPSHRSHPKGRRTRSLQSSSHGSQKSSREHSRPASPHKKSPNKDSAYQSHEQSTEKTASKTGSKSVSPTSSSLGRRLSKPRSNDDSNVHYNFRPVK